MRIRTETGAGKHAMSLAGRFDAHEVGTFRHSFEPLLAEPGSIVRVDLSNVVFVDSSALAALLQAQRDVADTGGQLVLVDLSDPVRIILELTALMQVFTVEQSVRAAGAVDGETS